jgi:plasmid maintenance system antidote protein VapI
MWLSTERRETDLTIINRGDRTMARTPIHPGVVLGDELKGLAISPRQLAEVIDVPPNRLYQIIRGNEN